MTDAQVIELHQADDVDPDSRWDLTDAGRAVPPEPGPPAPWGYHADGVTPRGKPGPKPKTGPAAPSPTISGPRRTTSKRSRPAGPKPSAGPRPAARSAPDYRPAVLGLLQIPAAGLGMAAMYAPEKLQVPLAADSATLSLFGPQLAEALHQTALDVPAFAALLERITTVGPYGAILAAVFPIVLQILCNHGIVPAGTMGALAPEEVLTIVKAQQDKAMGRV